jgi:hypothetical protein
MTKSKAWLRNTVPKADEYPKTVAATKASDAAFQRALRAAGGKYGVNTYQSESRPIRINPTRVDLLKSSFE